MSILKKNIKSSVHHNLTYRQKRDIYTNSHKCRYFELVIKCKNCLKTQESCAKYLYSIKCKDSHKYY